MRFYTVLCDVALPCATQHELTGKDAASLIKNGCVAVAEGANMPTTPEGVRRFLDARTAYGPAKAANAGGVATSALKMQQNASRDAWSFEFTERRLAQIMKDIHDRCHRMSEELGPPGNYAASFVTVAEAMVALGLI